MPAGVSWVHYVSFTACAFLSMAAGAQTVHVFYQPLKDMDVYVEKELSTFPNEIREKLEMKIRSEIVK